MDDFEDDELYDDEYYDQIEDDDDGESLKDKYERAKEYKEKYDKLKEKYSNKSTNNAESNLGKNAAKDTAKKGGKKAAEESGKKAGEEIAKQAGKKATTEAGKQVAKEGAKIAAKEGAKVAVEGAAASTGVGIIVAVAIELADRLNKIKKKIDKKVDKKIEETTGVKDASKKKKWILPILIFSILTLIFIVPALALYSVSETATSELTTLVRAREENDNKKLILFTKSEIKDLLNKDIEVSEEIANKLAEEGYSLTYEDNKYKSISYKNILKGYGNDLTNTFMPTDLTDASTGMEDVLEDGTSYDSLNEQDKDVAVSLKNVRKYLLAEIENFNKVEWNLTNLAAQYSYNTNKIKFGSLAEYENDTNKFYATTNNGLSNQAITNKNYTVKDDDNKDTMLKMPKLSDYGVDVSQGENVVARTYVDMLEPYMQKWIIPYTIYIDTQDEEFVDGVMNYMYHPATVSMFKLKRATKTSEFEYYLECNEYRYTRIVRKSTRTSDVGEKTSAQNYEYVGDNGDYALYAEGLNTKDKKLGEYIVSDTFVQATESGDSVYKQVISEVKLTSTPTIALDSSGNKMVKSVTVKRELTDGTTIPELVSVEGFYEVINREYTILPIDENNMPDSSTPTELIADSETGIGKQTVVDVWNETLLTQKSETKKYQVSYYDEEEYEDLGRNISRIEWYQDVMGSSFGAINASGTFGNGANKFEQAYNGQYKETLERIWDGIVSWGYSEEQAAAIIGNIAQESSFNVTSVNSIGATGLCQWLGGRRDMLYSFASSKGTDWSDLTTQLQFLCMEVAWDKSYSYASYQWSGHGQDLEAFKSGTVEQATVAFRKGFERCGEEEANDAVRLACAKSAYETFAGRNIEYPIEIIAASSTSTGGSTTTPGAGIGSGDIQYSYEDMYFAYYQIEQWYEQSGFSLTTNVIQRVALPEGGFSWPVETSGNDGAKKVLKLYGVENSDSINISTGNVHNYDSDEGLYKGANVIATHSGIVKKVEPVTDASTYAYIEIETDDGKYKTYYGNLSEINVAEGDSITKGQTIGKIGNTGSSATGSDIYLTYKMYYNGSKVDPLQYYYIKDSTGTRVDNYNDVDKTTISSGEYLFDGSRQYLAGTSEAVEGDINQGIEYYFTSSSGKTFNCYLQNYGPWAGMPYGSRSIKAQGCSITSVATVLTGYGYEVTPGTFSGGIASIFGLVKARIGTSHAYNYDGRRIDSAQTTRIGTATAAVKQAIANHLASGKEAIIHVVGPGNGGRNSYATSEHWMAVLDIRESGGDYEVFVADPWSTYSPRGWRTLDSMLVSLSDYILVNEDGE